MTLLAYSNDINSNISWAHILMIYVNQLLKFAYHRRMSENYKRYNRCLSMALISIDKINVFQINIIDIQMMKYGPLVSGKHTHKLWILNKYSISRHISSNYRASFENQFYLITRSLTKQEKPPLNHVPILDSPQFIFIRHIIERLLLAMLYHCTRMYDLFHIIR